MYSLHIGYIIVAVFVYILMEKAAPYAVLAYEKWKESALLHRERKGKFCNSY